MEMNLGFSTVARCRVYDKGNSEVYHTEDITLNFDKTNAMNFLFRFAPYAFNLNGFKVIFHMSNTSVDGLQLITDDKVYLVTNLNQLFADVHQGYFNMISSEKLLSIINYDFDTIDEDIKDEFENEESVKD